jgi:DNA (cytosine-5)-methyltransferase 1
MRYLSLFSGIEAVSVAWKPMGWECVAVAEILPYQSAVIAHHFPDVPNLGDVTKITEETLSALGKIDVVVFGSPCQDMSIAGKRQGLHAVKEDENHSSRLFFEGVRVFRMAQKVCGARFMLWENVVGALSSQEGRDFGTVLETLVGVEFSATGLVWGTEGVVFGRDSMCEWAVLDAQFFGVPQRRRRVFALLDTGDWRDRKPILLEADHLRKITPADRRTRQECARGAEGGVNGGSQVRTFDRQGISHWGDSPVASTISARDWKSATDLIAYGIPGNWIGRSPENGGNSTSFMSDLAPCLTATDQHAVISDCRVRRLTPVECERLQGFPDGWTEVGNPSIAKRYNALGRSMAVPVMAWIGRQIQKACDEQQAISG